MQNESLNRLDKAFADVIRELRADRGRAPARLKRGYTECFVQLDDCRQRAATLLQDAMRLQGVPTSEVGTQVGTPRKRRPAADCPTVPTCPPYSEEAWSSREGGGKGGGGSRRWSEQGGQVGTPAEEQGDTQLALSPSGVPTCGGRDTKGDTPWVELLGGPDNSSDYVEPTGRALAVWLALLGGMREGRIPEGMTVYHSGQCGRCGRELTVPQSTTLGFGEVCAEAEGLDWAGTVPGEGLGVDAAKRYVKSGRPFTVTMDDRRWTFRRRRGGGR